MNAAIGSRQRGRDALCIALAISGWLVAAPVQAQRIDEYLEPSIAGTGIEPGVTVESRVRPEYEMRGFHLGGFTVRPQLNESVGFDSNVTGTTPGKSSPMVETNATVQAVSNWARNSLGADVSVDNFQFTAQPRQSLTNWSASLGGTYDIGRDTLLMSVTHLNLNQSPRDLDVPQLTSAIPYRVNDFRLGYRAVFSRFSLRPTMEVTTYDFSNGTLAGGVPYIQSFRNRVVLSPSLEARYEMDPLRSLVLVVHDSKADYSNQTPGSPTLNFNDVSVLGGVNYDTGGLIRLRLLAGYETRHFSSNQFQTISAPIAEASAIYTPTGLTTLTLNAARYIEDSSSEATVAYTETALRVRVDHEYLKNLLFNAQAGLYFDNYQQNQGNQSLYSFGVGATWLLNRTMRLALTYDYTTRRGNSVAAVPSATQTQIFGTNYSENRILLQLRLGL